jgi:VTC domain
MPAVLAAADRAADGSVARPDRVTLDPHGDPLGLRDLRPVRLEELTERASLLTRVDRKYLLPVPDAVALVHELGGLDAPARVLEIGPRRTFGYESVYFDTPGLTCFLLAAHKRPTRFKVRTRTYLDSGECWLEVKTRDRRGRTVKQRLEYDVRDRTRLTDAGTAFVRDTLASTTAAHAASAGSGALIPTLVTRYERSTLFLPGDDTRLTIDTDLVCLQDEELPLRLPARAVVETKTAGHASQVDRLLWRRGVRPVQVSKYGTGLAALRPDLPAVKWRPVLRRHPFVPLVLPDPATHAA